MMAPLSYYGDMTDVPVSCWLSAARPMEGRCQTTNVTLEETESTVAWGYERLSPANSPEPYAQIDRR